jgi:hypothetical protein
MGTTITAKYTNLAARKNAIEKTWYFNEHLMISLVLKLSKFAVMATTRH